MYRKLATAFLFLFFGITAAIAQSNDKSDLPEYTGDNFSLEGALALFKQASSLEDFEKLLNEEKNNVNNLDLNNDGNTDYIVVQDIQETDMHVIVLSTYLGEKEKQDIATIGIEKTGDESAILQIEGDPDLYAANTIAEPLDINDESNERKNGPFASEVSNSVTVVNVWFWPSVRFLYAPRYVVWASPYRWGYYPKWWKPWRPYSYPVFYSRGAHYRHYYYRTNTHRVIVARKVYLPRRSKSVIIVHNRRGTTVIEKNRRGRMHVVRTHRRGGRG